MKSLRFTLLAASLLMLAACGQQTEQAAKPAPLLDEGLGTLAANAPMLERTEEVTDLAGSRNSVRRYQLEVPTGASNLEILTTGGEGDVDLYVKFGSAPRSQDFDCDSTGPTNEDSCSFSEPETGTYFIALFGASAYSDVTLRATYDESGDPEDPDPEDPDPEDPDPEDPDPEDPAPSGEFDIEFVFGPNVTSAQEQLFEEAAERWQEVIVGDLPSVPVSKSSNACGQGEPALNGTVDDVVIYAEVGPRDGAGGVLASAGPCLLRDSGSLTTYGVMNFDSADSNGPELFETILHEMGHVLGIGTLWTTKNVVNYSSGCPATPLYTGANARGEWNDLGGTGAVPVEDGGGGGTRCGHWDEETFNTELMTGFSEGSASEPLSRLTIGSLDDLGYEVDKGAADSYSLPNCSPNCLKAQNADATVRDVLLSPIGTTGPDGEVIKFDEMD